MAGIWVKKMNNSHPELREAQAVDEVAMLANFPSEPLETPDFTELAQTAYESFINYFKATFKMKSQLPQVDANDLPPTLCVCGHWCEQQCTAVTKAKSDLLIMQKQLAEQTNKAGLSEISAREAASKELQQRKPVATSPWPQKQSLLHLHLQILQ